MGVQRFDKKSSTPSSEEDLEKKELEEEDDENEEEDDDENEEEDENEEDDDENEEDDDENEEEDDENEEEKEPPKKRGRPKKEEQVGTPKRKLPSLTKNEKRALFQEYTNAEKELAAHKSKTDALEAAVKEKIKDIYESLGEGPFVWNKERLRIIRRISKKKGETIYFRKEVNEYEEI